MSHAIKLMAFFIISVALHGAGLWAAAGRYEAGEPEAPAGVAIVDRDLFFRHAERIESQASNPVSATDRITPRSAGTVRPSQPGESIARAPAVAAGEAEPERRAPASPAPGAMARLDPAIVEPAPPSRREASVPAGIDAERREPVRRAPVSPSAGTIAPVEPERRAPVGSVGATARLDLSTVEPAPPPRREATAPDGIDAERREPVRMSGVDATAPPAATRRQAQLSVPAPVPDRTSQALAPAGAERQASLVIAPPLRPSGDVRQAARAPAPEPVDEPDSRRAHRPLEADAQVHARAAEPAARTAADAAMPGTVETIAKAPPASLQAHAPARTTMAQVERGEAATAQAVSAAEAPRLAPPGTVETMAKAPPAGLQAHAPARAAMAQVERGEAEAAPAVSATEAPRLAPPGTVETIAKAPPASLQARASAPAAMAQVERGEPESAQAVSAAEALRLAPPATRTPADMAVRDEIAPRPADRPVAPETVTETAAVTAAAATIDPRYAPAAAPTVAAPADAAAPTTAVPAQAPRDRPALRGTLPAPLLAARQPQAARPVDAPPATNTIASAPAQAEGLRLRPSLADDIAPRRATMAAAPAEAVRPAEPSAATPPAPDPAPIATAAPRQLAAVAPQAPARRLESSDVASGRNDPADRFTRAYQGGECFFPLRLASRDGASRDGAAIRGYGLQAESAEMFRQAFAQALGTEPNVDWRPLTDAQCGGISFTRLVLGDTAPTVHIALERKELALGHNLAGRVTGSRLEFVTLLVADDSGVVHNVLDHLTPEGADLAFDIPVQPIDDGTDRVQLLMAVGASRPLPILESTTPAHSDDFFPALRDQAVETGAFLELGLEDFVILGGGT